jgi:hypothetical protein
MVGLVKRTCRPDGARHYQVLVSTVPLGRGQQLCVHKVHPHLYRTGREANHEKRVERFFLLWYMLFKIGHG